MKFLSQIVRQPHKCVVPLVGTWIEINTGNGVGQSGSVVPLVGTWIEIPKGLFISSAPHVVPLVAT